MYNSTNMKLISSCELIESQNRSSFVRCNNDPLSSHKYKIHPICSSSRQEGLISRIYTSLNNRMMELIYVLYEWSLEADNDGTFWKLKMELDQVYRTLSTGKSQNQVRPPRWPPSEHRTRRILPARRACHIIREIIDWLARGKSANSHYWGRKTKIGTQSMWKGRFESALCW